MKMSLKRRLAAMGLAVVGALGMAAPSEAVLTTLDTLTFVNITNNPNDEDLAQFITVEVIDPGVPGQVLFNVLYDGSAPADSFVSDVYFDDGTLLGISALGDSNSDILGTDYDEDPGVDFVTPAQNENMPGGGSLTPEFVTSAGFSAQEDNGGQPDQFRINPGEKLGILFNLQDDPNNPGNPHDVQSVLDALDPANFFDVNNPPADAPDGFLRLGIHAQGIPNTGDPNGDPNDPNGGSDGFVNIPPTSTPPPPPPPPVPPAATSPEPLTAFLSVMGLGSLSLATRRRR